jgi:hypothetical protein
VVLQRQLTADTVLTVSEAIVALRVPEEHVSMYRTWLAQVVRTFGPARLERVRWGDVVQLGEGEAERAARLSPAGLDGWSPGAGLRRSGVRAKGR